MTYRISGLSPEPFRHLFGLSDAELEQHQARRLVAAADSGFPDRVELRDAAEGESVLLVNYEHQSAATPFRASAAIFVLENAAHATVFEDTVPEALRSRLLSIRAFDAEGMMVDADVVDGSEADALIRRMLDKRDAQYLHAHYARRGCFAALVERAS